MIIITLDADSIIVLTLTEKASVASPIYLFELINQQTNNKVYFTAEDESAHIERYNEFIVNITGIAPGNWDYNVYEGTEELVEILTEYDTTDLNLLETGKAVVLETFLTQEEEVIFSEILTEKVYNE